MKRALMVFLIAIPITLHAQTIKIAAAANLRFALEEIKKKYRVANPKTNIVLNFGSSGTLSQQIINGAYYDIFMAADKIFPARLKEQGLVAGELKTYAFGKLVMWSSILDVSKGPEILTSESVNRIAIAKPDVAPYGERAIQFLKYYDLYDAVKDKIVYADNIAQAAQFAQTGNAEVGFIAMALTMAPEMKGTCYVLDTASYKPIEQAMVLIKNRQSNPEAARFVSYVLSPACKPIFENYGYLVP